MFFSNSDHFNSEEHLRDSDFCLGIKGGSSPQRSESHIEWAHQNNASLSLSTGNNPSSNLITPMTPPSPIFGDLSSSPSCMDPPSSFLADHTTYTSHPFNDDTNSVFSSASPPLADTTTNTTQNTTQKSKKKKNKRNKNKKNTVKKSHESNSATFSTPTPQRSNSPKRTTTAQNTNSTTNTLVCSQDELLKEPNTSYNYWTVLSRNNSLVNAEYTSKHPCKDRFLITIRTRTDPELPQVMEKMYSSLRYSLHIRLSSELFTDAARSVDGDFKIQCSIVYAESIDRVGKNSRTGKHIVQMDNETPLLLKKGKTYETKQKLSFSDVSYHHKNSAFRLKLQAFHTGFSHSDPILTAVSSDFMLFARRPQSEVKRARKRKKNPSPIEPALKRKKTFHSALQQSLDDTPASCKLVSSPHNFVEDSSTNTLKAVKSEPVPSSSIVARGRKLIDELHLIRKECSSDEWAQLESELQRTLPLSSHTQKKE